MLVAEKRKKVIDFIESNKGKMYRISWVKKTNGEIREMTALQSVFKHSKGGTVGGGHKEDLLETYDMELSAKLPEGERRKAYRRVWLDTVLTVKCGDAVLSFEGQ